MAVSSKIDKYPNHISIVKGPGIVHIIDVMQKSGAVCSSSFESGGRSRVLATQAKYLEDVLSETRLSEDGPVPNLIDLATEVAFRRAFTT